MFIAILAGTHAAAFVAGALCFRNNTKAGNTVVADASKAAAVVSSDASTVTKAATELKA